jgi:hypothetical protein
MGGVTTQDRGYQQIYGEGATRVHPFSIPRMMNNAAAAHVSMRHRLRGPTLSFATACSAAAHAIGEAAENISAGQSLAKPLAASGYFPSEVVEMIAVAEESNTLETVLTSIADSLERRTFRRLEIMVRLLEPMMLLLLAGVVLVVVIALLMPVMKMSTTM